MLPYDALVNPHCCMVGSRSDQRLALEGLTGMVAQQWPTVILTSSAGLSHDAWPLGEIDLTRYLRRGVEYPTNVLDVVQRLAADVTDHPDDPDHGLASLVDVLDRIGRGRIRFVPDVTGSYVRVPLAPMGGPEELEPFLTGSSDTIAFFGTWRSPAPSAGTGPSAAPLSKRDLVALLVQGCPPQALQLWAYLPKDALTSAGWEPYFQAGVRLDLPEATLARIQERWAMLGDPLDLGPDPDAWDHERIATGLGWDIAPHDLVSRIDVGVGLHRLLDALDQDLGPDTPGTATTAAKNGLARIRSLFEGARPLQRLWEPGTPPLIISLGDAQRARVLTLAHVLLDEAHAEREVRKILVFEPGALRHPGVADLGVLVARVGRRYGFSLLATEASLIEDGPLHHHQPRPRSMAHHTLRNLLHNAVALSPGPIGTLRIDAAGGSTGMLVHGFEAGDVSTGASLLSGLVPTALADQYAT